MNLRDIKNNIDKRKVYMYLSVKTILLVSLVFFCACGKTHNETETVIALQSSDIVGRWDVIEYIQFYYSDTAMPDPIPNIQSSSSHFTFWSNGRFETRIIWGYLVEGTWTMESDGIHTFVNQEPYLVLSPVEYSEDKIALRLGNNRIVCKKGVASEFTSGYGSIPIKDYFQVRDNVDSFIQAIVNEQNTFNQALEELKSIVVPDPGWSDINQIETLWYSSYSMMARANQAIDALPSNNQFQDAITTLKYLRAWSSYVRLICWGNCIPYWEHVGKDQIMPPAIQSSDIVFSALKDLANCTGPDASVMTSVLNSFIKYSFNGTPYFEYDGQILKNWGVSLPPDHLYLPVADSWARYNMNSLISSGWTY